MFDQLTVDYLAERTDRASFDREEKLRDIHKSVAEDSAAALKRFKELLGEVGTRHAGRTAIHEILERISATR